jgi:hypothetical protein
MTSVIICGGRRHERFTQAQLEWLIILKERLAITEVVEGGAQQWDGDAQAWLGADYHARLWAKNNGIDVRTFWANWDKHGKAAGPIRNGAMKDYLLYRQAQGGQSIAVIAFNGERGTGDMIQQATDAGIQVYAWHVYEGMPHNALR